MANRLRGQIELKAGEAVHILRFTVNAFCDLETELGRPMSEILAGFMTPESRAKVSLSLVRALVWAGLKDAQPSVTIAAAGEIMDAAGPPTAVAKVAEALQAAFPDESGRGDAPASPTPGAPAATG
jgi:hypothetical protein